MTVCQIFREYGAWIRIRMKEKLKTSTFVISIPMTKNCHRPEKIKCFRTPVAVAGILAIDLNPSVLPHGSPGKTNSRGHLAKQ